MKNRPEIDGLRAIAVLPVLFFHADMGFSGGYVGVDVFFVISGFLITGLILKDLERGQFRLLEFWERRVRRIVPALALVVITVILAGWFLLLPQDYRELGRSTIAQGLLLSNVYFWRDSGYFAQAAEVKPLLHTWSLAVEEQFYLLFPFLLVALNRFGRKRLIQAVGLILFGSFCLSIYGSYRQPSATFYLLPTRAWELMLGALLAMLPIKAAGTRWTREALSFGGLAAIFYAVFFYDRATRFPGAAALLPCVGTALIIWANQPQLTRSGRLLASWPLVALGLISYSLYLWHWPVLVFSKYWVLEPLPIPYRVLLLVLSVVLAAFSWKFVERPFRQRVVFKARPKVFAFAGSMCGVLLFSGYTIDQRGGIPSRIRPEIKRYADGITNKAFLHELSLKEVQEGKLVELGAGDKQKPVSIVVWGDSHAMSIMPVMDALCKDNGVRGLGAAHSSTPPLLGYVSDDVESLGKDSIPFNQGVLDIIRKEKVRKVLLVAYWGFYVEAENGTAELRQGLLATVRALREAGVSVWVLRQVPRHRWNVPRALASAVFFGRDPGEMGLPIEEHLRSARKQDPIFAGLTDLGAVVLDPTAFFVRQPDLCRAVADGKVLYHDSHHLSIDGAMKLRPLFEDMFTEK